MAYPISGKILWENNNRNNNNSSVLLMLKIYMNFNLFLMLQAKLMFTVVIFFFRMTFVVIRTCQHLMAVDNCKIIICFGSSVNDNTHSPANSLGTPLLALNCVSNIPWGVCSQWHDSFPKLQICRLHTHDADLPFPCPTGALLAQKLVTMEAIYLQWT